MKVKPKLITILVLCIILLIIVFQNLQPIQVRLLFWGVELSKTLIFFIVLVGGFIVGWLTKGQLSSRKLRKNS